MQYRSTEQNAALFRFFVPGDLDLDLWHWHLNSGNIFVHCT